MPNTITITHDEQHTQSNKIFATLNGVHKQARKMFITKDGVHTLFYESGVKWNKYDAVATEHYRYVRDGDFVGRESSNYYDYWWTSPTYPTQYEFSETEGYYEPPGVTKVNSENIVGAYLIYWNVVYQITGIEPAPEADWASNLYRISSICVDSATAELESITYTKGSTLIGAVYAEEGARPVEGEIKDSGNGWYIISNEEGVYYYERVL